MTYVGTAPQRGLCGVAHAPLRNLLDQGIFYLGYFKERLSLHMFVFQKSSLCSISVPSFPYSHATLAAWLRRSQCRQSSGTARRAKAALACPGAANRRCTRMLQLPAPISATPARPCPSALPPAQPQAPGRGCQPKAACSAGRPAALHGVKIRLCDAKRVYESIYHFGVAPTALL